MCVSQDHMDVHVSHALSTWTCMCTHLTFRLQGCIDPQRVHCLNAGFHSNRRVASQWVFGAEKDQFLFMKQSFRFKDDDSQKQAMFFCSCRTAGTLTPCLDSKHIRGIFYPHVSRNRYTPIVIYAAVCTGPVQTGVPAPSHGHKCVY